MSASIVVVKIGGSLLTQSNFVQRLRFRLEQISDQFSPAHLVLLVGGGPLVEGLRSIDRANPLSDHAAHWTAIHLMNVNAGLMKAWWPEVGSTSSLAVLRENCISPGATLFFVEDFLKNEEPSFPGTQLPSSWDVTSDSIAARIGGVLAAQALVLLKPESTGPNWVENSKMGVVDAFFPRVIEPIDEVFIQAL